MNWMLARVEGAGVVRARWFYGSVALSIGLVLFFVIVGTRESALVGFTGLGRVMQGVVQASLLFVPALSLLSTSQVVTTARQQGVLEWYLAQPIARRACFFGLYVPRLAAVAIPVTAAVALLGLGALALGQPVPVAMLVHYLGMLVGQALCFTALGMLVGVLSRTPEQALLHALVVWMAAVALVDFAVLGLMLKWDLPPYAVFGLAGLNPVQAGRIGMLAGIDPELGVLGPVGTWMTVTLGGPLAIAYGLIWPALVGVVALVGAQLAFERRDAL